MSVMFPPPVAMAAPLLWRQVCGFAQGSDPFFARVRAAQLQAINRYVPFNVAAMMINVGALLCGFRALPEYSFMVRWSIVMGLLALAWTLRFRQVERRGEALEATPRYFWTITAEMIAFGLFWAALSLHMLPAVPVAEQALLVILSLSVMGASGYAAAAMPICSLAVVVIIGTSTLAAIPSGSPLASPLISLAFITFSLLIMRGVLVTSHAMMARMRTQFELGERTEIVRLLLNEFEANGSDWLIEVDTEGCLTHVSPRLADVAKRPRESLLGQPLVALLGEERRGEARSAVQALANMFIARRAFRDITVPVAVAGETRWWSLSGTPKNDASGNFAGFRGVGRDVTEVRRSHERIAQLARFDPLTGLANRALFRESLDDALARAQRTGRQCALLFIDLDRFKAVNDSMGHSAGDRLLRDVAVRLREAVGGGATIARLGGDEFAVVLSGATPQRAEAAARAVVAAVARPFEIDRQPVSVGASVGFAMGPGDGASGDRLLKSADLALYEVKSTGRGDACRYVPEIRERAEERRAMEMDLGLALSRGELELAYQPVVDAGSERIVGFEALLRWNHPRLGRVPPDKFIPVAEETGSIVPIGHWVIEQACARASHWPSGVRIAVNLSPAQIHDPDLVEVVCRSLDRNGIDPGRLELEITESLFLDEKPSTIEKLAALKALGVCFALDDFGTGYSSLGYLHKAAFSRIKIDRSFVARATHANGEASAIIQSIVNLAESLNMTTTAEGTETRAEFELCRDLGCAQAQGYLFGKPMTPEQATALVRPMVAGVRMMAE
jgi:diguanylate cyclase (GGDEF)-like protein